MINLKKKVLNEINIVEIVSEYVDLEKKGQNYGCICPFHDDTNPSLIVSEQKQIFKCFVCGEGGTAIDFVQKYEKIPYNRALEKLAKISNIAIPKKSNINDKYYEVLENIKIFYNKILDNSRLGEEAKKYLLEERNLTNEDIKQFELGFSPLFSEALYQFITNSNDSTKELSMQVEELKIFNEKNQDFLQGRITFPIYNDLNELVGFSGRDIKGKSQVKYLNSKETKLFHKGNILYNFNNVVGNNVNELLIVEGYFDVITAVKKGITNVVATMGTAFNQQHISLLKKHKVKKVYLGFDSDKAGQLAIEKSAQLLIKNYIEVEVVTYEEAKDIDEYLNTKEVTWNDLIGKAQDFSLYIANKNVNNSDINQKASVINVICENLAFYQDTVKVNLLIEEIANMLTIEKSVFQNTLENIKQKKNNISVVSHIEVAKVEDDIDKNKISLEEQLFYLITIKKENFEYLEKEIQLGNFEFLNLKKDYDMLKELYNLEEEIDEILLLDEIESYYHICEKLRKDNYVKFLKENNSVKIIYDLIHATKKKKTIKKFKIFNI